MTKLLVKSIENKLYSIEVKIKRDPNIWLIYYLIWYKLNII